MNPPMHIVDMDNWPRTRCGINLRNPPARTTWVAAEHIYDMTTNPTWCPTCRPEPTLPLFDDD